MEQILSINGANPVSYNVRDNRVLTLISISLQTYQDVVYIEESRYIHLFTAICTT